MWKSIRSPLLMLSISFNLAVIAVWLVQFAWAQHSLSDGMAPQLDSHREISSRLHREIGVTPAQWQQIEPLLLDFRQSSASQQQRLETLRQQLLGLLAETPTNMEAIRGKQNEILLGQEQIQDLVIGHLLKEKAILSPEQLKQLIQEIHRQCMHSGDMTSQLDSE